ncbi:MAG TPA: TlpA disulfide reductase family protein [Chitinophagaceae bacterium]|nr:TlpA disulfide reductase family protein [Chitinophagaceae bacterium]
MIKLFLFCLVFAILPFSVIAQKQFQFKLILPPNIKTEKLRVSVDNGKAEVPLKPLKSHKNKLWFTGEYYGLYAGIIFKYPRKSENLWYQSYFFLKEKPAIIAFFKPTTIDSIFGNYAVQHAYDFKKAQSGMSAEIREEVNKAHSLLRKYGQSLFNGKKTKIKKEFLGLTRQINEKSLEYVRKHSDSYYSFYYFRRNSLISMRPDSVRHFFNTVFPDKFKNSTEGQIFLKMLDGIKATSSPHSVKAPLFKVKDIDGNTVTLSNYKNKKYVLLTFWATWCGPCRSELPILKKIRAEYSKKDLVMIAASYNEGNYDHYLDFIKRHEMNWINIYNNIKLSNAYGGSFSIPQTYLIGKNGKIIYSRAKSKKKDLSELKDILKKKLLE